jgi:serine/threonine protein phosphatase PrpC
MNDLPIYGSTHPGMRRKENQDAFIARQLWSAGKALLAVVDGVGGYTGGEKAAAIARDSIEQYMQIPRGDTLTMLREAVVFANNRIVEERKLDQQTSEMCCVLTTLVTDAASHCFYYVHVGDTRLYRYRNGSLEKLTRDHSFVGIKEDAGDISELEAMRHPHRNQILREVGSVEHRIDDEGFMDYGKETLLPGDLLLLCSDGLTDMATSQQLSALLSTTQPIADKADKLIALANEMGGHDNITVVLLQYEAIMALAQQEATTIPPVNERTSTGGISIPVSELPLSPSGELVSHKREGKGDVFKSKWLTATLLLLLAVLVGWYFVPPKKPVVRQSSHARNTVDSLPAIDSSQTAPGARTYVPAVPGPAVSAKTDTLHLQATWNYEDLKHYADSTGSVLVLMLAKNNTKRFAAIEINTRSAKPGDTLVVRNLRITGFETGIRIQIPILLKTDNLLFENTKYPFNYASKPDSKYAASLLTNTTKQ